MITKFKFFENKYFEQSNNIKTYIVVLKEHFLNNKPIKKSDVPKELINKNWSYGGEIKTLYSGVSKSRPETYKIMNWSYDLDTAGSFSDKYDDGIIIKMDIGDFSKLNDYISLDAFYEYIFKNGTSEEKDEIEDFWYSENEYTILI